MLGYLRAEARELQVGPPFDRKRQPRVRAIAREGSTRLLAECDGPRRMQILIPTPFQGQVVRASTEYGRLERRLAGQTVPQLLKQVGEDCRTRSRSRIGILRPKGM